MRFVLNPTAKRIELHDDQGRVVMVAVFPGGSTAGLPTGVQQVTPSEELTAIAAKAFAGDAAAAAELEQAMSAAGAVLNTSKQVGVAYDTDTLMALAALARSVVEDEVKRQSQEARFAAEARRWRQAGLGEPPFQEAPAVEKWSPEVIPAAAAGDPEMIRYLTAQAETARLAALAARERELERVKGLYEERVEGARRLGALRELQQRREALENAHRDLVARLSVDPRNDERVAMLQQQHERELADIDRAIGELRMTYWPEETQRNLIASQYKQVYGPDATPPADIDPVTWSYQYQEEQRRRRGAVPRLQAGGIVPLPPGMASSDMPEYAKPFNPSLGTVGSHLQLTLNNPATQKWMREQAERSAARERELAAVAEERAALERQVAWQREQIRLENERLDQQFLTEVEELRERAREMVAENPFIAARLAS